MDDLGPAPRRGIKARRFSSCGLSCGAEISPGQQIVQLGPRRWAHAECVSRALLAAAR